MKPPQNKPTDKRKKTGLARAISKLGYCSRSKAVEEIKAGRVGVNGVVRRNPETPVWLGKDKISVDGKIVAAATRVYLMMNKTRGLVTTASDEKNRATVCSLLPPGMPWVSPVGRLDQASEGLLLFTNDSSWAARITSPESHLDKVYHVQISAIAAENLLNLLRKGITTTDGDFLRVKSATMLRGGRSNSWLEIILDEGKNRQIRRMLEHCGIEVLRLVRVAIGPLLLGALAKSSCRPLSHDEMTCMDRALVKTSHTAA